MHIEYMLQVDSTHFSNGSSVSYISYIGRNILQPFILAAPFSFLGAPINSLLTWCSFSLYAYKGFANSTIISL